MAHNDLLSTGRICDWASHKIEYELSAVYDIASDRLEEMAAKCTDNDAKTVGNLIRMTS